jgi:pyruvate formate lyase activating enzyme
MPKQEQSRSDDKKTTQGYVFNIQRYSIHDGPGIRTTVFLKGCPLRCFWCQNPESQRIRPEILFRAENCTRCAACVKRCSAGAIDMNETYALTDREKCTGCGACADVCPNEARRLEGKRMSVQEVMEIVLKDRKLYSKSNGGLTISGGEPTMQPEFTRALLQSAKEQGLHTVLETCGHAKWKIIEGVLPYTDYIFYDVKTMDAERHRSGTQYDNTLILENARKLAHAMRELHVRCPLIPAFNDAPEDVSDITEFVVEALGLPYNRFTLLRYNKYAEGKYKQLGRENEALHSEPQSPEKMEALCAVIRSYEKRDRDIP